MPDLWSDCSRFLNRYHCQIVAAIVITLFPAVTAGLAWYLSASGEMDRLARANETRSVGTAQALDALTAETRDTNTEIVQTLGAIQSDIRLLTYRLDSGARMRAPNPALAKPE